MADLRLLSNSLGFDPGGLAPGRDLALDIDIAHGDRLADGVFFHDLLDIAERERIDQLTVGALAAWRSAADPLMSADGVCWPWIWEWDIHRELFQWAHRALGLRRALELHRPDALMLAHEDPIAHELALAVAAPAGLAVSIAPGAAAPRPVVDPPPEVPALTRARRSALRAMRRAGLPSLMRRDSVLFLSYWPLEPVFDAMLARPEWRPAVSPDWLPRGPRRWLGAVRQGGFMGLPTMRDTARAHRQAGELEAHVADVPFVVDGLDLSRPFQRALRKVIADRVGVMARAPVVRRALRGGRARHLVAAFDSDPGARLTVALAREAGVPTTCLAHGAFFVPQTLNDMDVCDQAVVWTEAVAPKMDVRGRPVYSIGYPVPVDPPPQRTSPAPVRSPDVVVMGHYAVAHTAMLDKRLTARSWRVAVEAVRAVLPGSRIVLRPHPFERFATDDPLAGRFGTEGIAVDRATPMTELLARADLVIGGTSVGTLQGALAGCPAVVLNLSGFEWPWPLGHDTSVPVARSAEDLEAILGRFADEGGVPGRQDILDALGVDGRDPVSALLDVLAGRGR